MTNKGRGEPRHYGGDNSSSERLNRLGGARACVGPAAGDKGQGLSMGGGSTAERLLSRYGGFFEELGSGCLATLKQLLEQVELAVGTAAANDVNLLAKLYVIKSAKACVETVTQYFSRFLPPTVVNNLRADLTFLLERAEEVVVRFG